MNYNTETSTFSHVQSAIKIIRMAADAAKQKGSKLELAYSGGKDSEIMRCLAIEAGVDFEPIYKQTTIDRPFTAAYCHDRGVTILRPQFTFFSLVEKKGFPTRRVRWCCERFKEYKVYDVALVGVRRDESTKRSRLYNEISQCRVYHRGGSCEQFYPLLDWQLCHEREFVEVNKIELHPHYYDDSGKLCISKRLGCIGCPLRGDNGKRDLKEFPKFLRQLLISSYKWWNFTNGATKRKFSSPQKLLLHNLFCRSYDDYLEKFEHVLFGFSDIDALKMISDYFCIDLDLLISDYFHYLEKK